MPRGHFRRLTVLTISVFTMHMRFNYTHRQSKGDSHLWVWGHCVLSCANEMVTALAKHFGLLPTLPIPLYSSTLAFSATPTTARPPFSHSVCSTGADV